jgi:predicted DNA-binding protein (MmcQ/YjbR family)
MARAKKGISAALEVLRAFGLTYPGAHTKSPWPGHLDLAVNDKTFAYLSAPGDPVKISCKLPFSSLAALELPFTTPAAYGLGKSGWVSASFEATDALPLEMLKAWIDESYRAQAPKRLSRGLPPFSEDAGISAEEAPAVRQPPAAKKAALEKKATPKKAAKVAKPTAARATKKRRAARSRS